MAQIPFRHFKSNIKAHNLNTAPRTLTAATTLTAKDAGGAVFLDLAGGFTVTLPAATGSGRKYRFIVKTASNAYVVESQTNAGFFRGMILINDSGDTPASTVDAYTADGSTHDFIRPTTAGGGGTVGDWFEVIDLDTNVWAVHGQFQDVVDPVTPFATS